MSAVIDTFAHPRPASVVLPAKSALALAELARGLAEALLHCVQQAAALNLAAARSLLGHGKDARGSSISGNSNSGNSNSGSGTRDKGTGGHCAIAKAGVALAADASHDALQSSWRAYCICATSAAQVLQLTQGYTRNCEAQLWQAIEEGLAALPQVELARVRAVRDAFAALREATTNYLDAAVGTHQALAAIAQAQR